MQGSGVMCGVGRWCDVRCGVVVLRAVWSGGVTCGVEVGVRRWCEARQQPCWQQASEASCTSRLVLVSDA